MKHSVEWAHVASMPEKKSRSYVEACVNACEKAGVAWVNAVDKKSQSNVLALAVDAKNAPTVEFLLGKQVTPPITTISIGVAAALLVVITAASYLRLHRNAGLPQGTQLPDGGLATAKEGSFSMRLGLLCKLGFGIVVTDALDNLLGLSFLPL